jgi:hypothetical protein
MQRGNNLDQLSSLLNDSPSFLHLAFVRLVDGVRGWGGTNFYGFVSFHAEPQQTIVHVCIVERLLWRSMIIWFKHIIFEGKQGLGVAYRKVVDCGNFGFLEPGVWNRGLPIRSQLWRFYMWTIINDSRRQHTHNKWHNTWQKKTLILAAHIVAPTCTYKFVIYCILKAVFLLVYLIVNHGRYTHTKCW